MGFRVSILFWDLFANGWLLILFLIALLFRGIDVVRNKIKMFAQKRVTLSPGRHKIVILDEADRLVPILVIEIGDYSSIVENFTV